jgi:Bacterial capsule synthesis protein PGA_cap
MNIIITGDLFGGGNISQRIMGKNIISTIYDQADIRMTNLESPLTDTECVIEKSVLYGRKDEIKILKKNNIDLVGLSNNHIQDKCIDGFRDTILSLKKAGIIYFGAGENIDEATKPIWINNDVCIMAYCEKNNSYLKNVKIASKTSYGVAQLEYDGIINDIKNIPEGKSVILLFHWGREHVHFPPYENIILAKKLLEHDKVRCIVGSHSHIMQGVIRHNNKYAFMSLGNFLFPNFYMKPINSDIIPSNTVFYPTDKNVKQRTKSYCKVFKETYKKWGLSNRISLMINYNIDEDKYSFHIMKKEKNKPIVKELTGLGRYMHLVELKIKSMLCALPKFIYRLLEIVNMKWVNIVSKNRKMLLYIQQIGLVKTIKYLKKRKIC